MQHGVTSSWRMRSIVTNHFSDYCGFMIKYYGLSGELGLFHRFANSSPSHNWNQFIDFNSRWTSTIPWRFSFINFQRLIAELKYWKIDRGIATKTTSQPCQSSAKDSQQFETSQMRSWWNGFMVLFCQSIYRYRDTAALYMFQSRIVFRYCYCYEICSCYVQYSNGIGIKSMIVGTKSYQLAFNRDLP